MLQLKLMKKPDYIKSIVYQQVQQVSQHRGVRAAFTVPPRDQVSFCEINGKLFGENRLELVCPSPVI